MAKHAKLGPSSADRWCVCPGSVALSEGLKEESSSYADEGTAAHFLAAHCLETKTEVADYDGAVILLMEDEDGEHFEMFSHSPVNELWRELNSFTVDDDMIEHVGQYVSDVRRVQLAINGELHVEQRLSIEYMTGEEGAEGTSDTVIVSDEFLVVADLKYGMGVRVNAEDNRQLKMYAASAKRKYELMHDFEKIQVAILQPRLGHMSQFTYTLKDITKFEDEVREAVVQVNNAFDIHKNGGDISDYLVVDEDACRWCKAKATCPKLTAFVAEAIEADFEDLTQEAIALPDVVDPEILSIKAKAIDLIEMWCKAVRGKVESVLLEGKPVPGFKLVEGKMGHRKWSDEQEAEKVFKSMRLKVDEMYDMKLISPTSAEKVLKSTPKRWARVKELITQTKGGPSVAPESDKRPAMIITPVGDDMEDLSGEDLM